MNWALSRNNRRDLIAAVYTVFKVLEKANAAEMAAMGGEIAKVITGYKEDLERDLNRNFKEKVQLL